MISGAPFRVGITIGITTCKKQDVALAMECFQAVNSAIELIEFTISEQKIGYPVNYKENFDMLEKVGLIDSTSVKNLYNWLRHLLLH